MSINRFGMPEDQFSIGGFKVHVVSVKLVPFLKLSDRVQVSDEFRAEFDKWLLDTFGTREECPIPKDFMYMFGNTMVMRPEMAVSIRNLTA